MNAKAKKGSSIWKVLIALLLVAATVSITKTTITFAAKPTMPAFGREIIRSDMMNIAERYADFRWRAAATHLIQYPYPPSRFNEQDQLLEPDSTQVKYIGAVYYPHLLMSTESG